VVVCLLIKKIPSSNQPAGGLAELPGTPVSGESGQRVTGERRMGLGIGCWARHLTNEVRISDFSHGPRSLGRLRQAVVCL
jgi:hypothetical protein